MFLFDNKSSTILMCPFSVAMCNGVILEKNDLKLHFKKNKLKLY